ncbi:OmpH family outer membrane protein [Paracoccus sediminicola]|uniref:OmpH family outer membrane protein n=1 Tax=Paracoccus sediminicola TaxID=3017783 RepID=UPI0022F04C6D|nr:OmpH family outer membrane protein [Paracoccus sediminicola]WBU58100.1 OmpH family outer membrane protein [Paracoccus sediminicola]
MRAGGAGRALILLASLAWPGVGAVAQSVVLPAPATGSVVEIQADATRPPVSGGGAASPAGSGAAGASGSDMPTGVLVVNFERAFAESAWGRNAVEGMQQAASAIDAENRRLEDQLTAEEQALTAERDSLSASAFRQKAEAFDNRAQSVRRERAAVLDAFQEQDQAMRNAFFQASLPVAAELMQERNAAIILDRQQAVIAANAVDITDALVARLDETVGEGPGFPDAETLMEEAGAEASRRARDEAIERDGGDAPDTPRPDAPSPTAEAEISPGTDEDDTPDPE